MIAYDIDTKKILWDQEMEYTNPPILSGEKIITNGESFSLLTGEPVYENDLLTGEPVKWNFKREYGCGYVIASEHLLTFRSASAGFVNLDLPEGTGSLGGFKAGCSANLIVADGVLNSPDYTRTCQCPYQNQTSLALIHMPWMTYWTNSNYRWSGKRIQQLGLNLNAPGDRTSGRNTLWLEFPFIAGVDPGIPVKLDTQFCRTYRKEPVSVVSEETPWISASSVEGILRWRSPCPAKNPCRKNTIPSISFSANRYARKKGRESSMYPFRTKKSWTILTYCRKRVNPTGNSSRHLKGSGQVKP